jgi:ATP-binding cassette subfamily F protein 3
MESVNLVLLDEPTHHLDLAGKEVLEDALGQYPGAIVVVTHDRSLMARLASRVVEVDRARVRLYPGGYDDYESNRLARGAAAPAPAPARVPVAAAEANRPRVRSGGKVTAIAGAATTPAPSREQQRRVQNEQRRRERETARIEQDIETRETRMRELETTLADPALYHDAARSKDLVHEYERLRAETEVLWQRLGELG